MCGNCWIVQSLEKYQNFCTLRRVNLPVVDVAVVIGVDVVVVVDVGRVCRVEVDVAVVDVDVGKPVVGPGNKFSEIMFSL